jgi:GNAT superfamily N-acetyltransferase
MKSDETIRAATVDDVSAVREIAIATGLFDEESWPDVEGVMVDSVRGALGDHSWIVLEKPDVGVVAAAYFAPEPFSNQMWNLYFLGVLPGRQGDGSGGALIGYVEGVLREKGERVLIIETSGVDSFEPTRAFYRNRGFDEEARIREFYGPGDDKVVFWKALYA